MHQFQQLSYQETYRLGTKDKVRGIGDDLEGDQGRELIQVVKRELTEHGHPLNKGNRDFEGIAKVAVVSKLEVYAETASTNETDSEEKFAPIFRNTVSYSRGFRRCQSKSSTKRREGCYICREDYFWKYCPQKRCPACGQKGHRLQECKVDKPNPGGRRVFTTEMALPELSVVVKAEINGVPITVILDSGAGPSVLDYGTLKNLGLAKHLSDNPGKIYGLSQVPVVVIGSEHLTVDLGDDQIVL